MRIAHWFADDRGYIANKYFGKVMCKHGICHGGMDIIRVKFIFTLVEFSREDTLFVVN